MSNAKMNTVFVLILLGPVLAFLGFMEIILALGAKPVCVAVGVGLPILGFFISLLGYGILVLSWAKQHKGSRRARRNRPLVLFLGTFLHTAAILAVEALCVSGVTVLLMIVACFIANAAKNPANIIPVISGILLRSFGVFCVGMIALALLAIHEKFSNR